MFRLASTMNLQDGRASEVATIAEVRSSHHVLRVEHLLSELRYGNGAERVCATAGEGSESDHEEVKTGEGDHVYGKLAQVGVQLARETKTCCDTRHDCGDKVVKVGVRGVGKLESPHADVVESL